MPTLSEDLAFRGLIHQVTDPELPKRFDRPGLTLYAGFDPSADSLHVGNLLQLCTLRRFQDAGHRVISLAGGGTGMIGDPGGKQDERQLLDLATIEQHLEGIRPQLAQFLDLDRALLVNNADWLQRLSTLEYLRDVGKHFTVNQMVAKESVRTRFERPDHGISYTEFSYMLLQAYDFLRLHVDHGCDVQLGGSDQWGNITMGVELIRKVCGDEAWGVTTPLVLKPDGTKYGKSESGTVWLDPARTSPFAMFQFFVNTPDEQVGELLRFFTFLAHAEIEALDAATSDRPRQRAAQRALARAVTSLVHGEAEVVKCEEASAALFGEEIAGLSEEMLLAVTEDAPTTDVGRVQLLDGLTLVDLLERTGLVKSRGEARRTVEQGGAYVNNVRQADGAWHLRLRRPAPRSLPAVAPRRAQRPRRARFMRRRTVATSAALAECVCADPHGVHGWWAAGVRVGPDEDLGEHDVARRERGDAGVGQRAHRPRGAQRLGRPARCLRHDRGGRRIGQQQSAGTRCNGQRVAQPGLRARGHRGQRVLRRQRERGAAHQGRARRHPGRCPPRGGVATYPGRRRHGAGHDDHGGQHRELGRRRHLRVSDVTSDGDTPARHRRRVLWALPTGLYLVGSRAEESVNLMTANLVVQVCVEPALVGVAIESASVTARLIVDGARSASRCWVVRTAPWSAASSSR